MSNSNELKIQKGIRQAEDDLVIWIQEALEKSQYDKQGKDKLEESQFRNLVRVSDNTESVEVIKNFLRYQVGRGNKWGRGKDSLAERIIIDIDQNIKTTAENIFKQINAEIEQSKVEQKKYFLEEADYKKIRIELTRRYLGYGARYLKYKLEGGVKEKDEITQTKSQNNQLKK